MLFSAAFALAANVRYNHAGYDAALPKSLVVESNADLSGTAYSFADASGNTVLSGTFPPAVYVSDWALGPGFYRIDFSSVTLPGTYTLSFFENGSADSLNVPVLEKALSDATLGPVLSYFKNDRNTNSDLAVAVYGSSATRDVHGGWNDASGDVSKYLSHLSYANYLNPQQIPLTVWALAFASERMPLRVAAVAGEGFARTEALYGADFLLRMLDPEGFFYMTVFDNWGAGSRYLCAFSHSDGVKSSAYKTAFREGGGMAIAALARASTLGASGDSSSAAYYAGAARAFLHLQGKQSAEACEYCDDGKENIIDDYTALLAAVELYNASIVFEGSANSSYLEAARLRATSLVNRLSDDGYFFSDAAKSRPFWHASDAGLPLIALVRYLELEPELSCSNKIAPLAQKHLEWLVKVTDVSTNPFGYAKQVYRTGDTLRTGYFIPHDNESEYWWQGESARIASLAAAGVYAARSLGVSDSLEAFAYAADQLDWILGKNPYGVSFMEGVGLKNPPPYTGTLGKGMLKGGIANGVTGKNTDGSGIVWNNVSAAGFSESWQNWRWIEQWLPHSTWYLMALAARYDETSKTLSLPRKGKKAPAFAVEVLSGTLRISANRPLGEVEVFGLDGRKVLRASAPQGEAVVSLGTVRAGVYFVRAGTLGIRKIVLR